MLRQIHAHDHSRFGVRAHLHVVARRDRVVAVLHQARFRLAHTDPRWLAFLLALAPLLHFLQLLQRLLQSLLTLSLGSFPRLPLPPLARLALGILLYQLTDGFQPLLHRWFAPERIHSR